jgi:hypothetical protein
MFRQIIATFERAFFLVVLSVLFPYIQKYLSMAIGLLPFLIVAISVVASNCATYRVTDSIIGTGFLSAFSHETIVVRSVVSITFCLYVLTVVLGSYLWPRQVSVAWKYISAVT